MALLEFVSDMFDLSLAESSMWCFAWPRGLSEHTLPRVGFVVFVGSKYGKSCTFGEGAEGGVVLFLFCDEQKETSETRSQWPRPFHSSPLELTVRLPLLLLFV